MNNTEIHKGWEAFGKIQVLEGDEIVEVLIDGQIYMKFLKGDEGSRRMGIVQLCESGKGTQEDIAKAFGVHVKSVYNYVNAYKGEGISGLVSQASGPKDAWKITPDVKYKILETAFRNKGITLEEIAQELERKWSKGVSINSVRNVLIENGLIKEYIRDSDVRIEQQELLYEGELPLLYNEIEEGIKQDVLKKEGTHKHEDAVRTGFNNRRNKAQRYHSPAQRQYIGQLEQRSSGIRIERGEYNSYAAGLLYVPLLRKYNFISTIKELIKIDTYEGYSLEELCLALFYFDVFGFRSVENFKTVYPEEYGLLIGKLSSPSIVTLRRFLQKVRELIKGEELIEAFTKQYLRLGLANCVVVYIDGHFLPYWGIEIIRKGFYTVRDMPMKGSYNFIANDEDFNPILFLIRSSDEDMIRKIPEIINTLKRLSGEVGMAVKDMTVIFDRGGFSAELFRLLDDREGGGQNKVHFYTWGKNIDDWVKKFTEEEFMCSVKVTYKVQKSEQVHYIDTERQVNKYGTMRVIALMSGSNKKRSAIYTNDWDADAKVVIQRMCSRWGQENMIKALKLRHVIDYHPGYVSEELEEQPSVDNPEFIELKEERSRIKSRLHELELRLAEKICKDTKDDMVWKDVKEKETELFAEIAVRASELTLIEQKIRILPKEKKYDEVHDGEKMCELDYEKKRFLDCIKVFAYHMQKQMCDILLKYFPVQKEVYSALDMIIKRGADVRLENGKLVVRLKRFKDIYIDYAARHLCQDLNEMKPVTIDRYRLPIRYEVA